jgi:hypothetical protein
MPKRRASAGRRVMSLPSSSMRPEVGSTKPARHIRNVVLPERDGPSSVRNSPSAIPSETRSSASVTS